MKPMRHAILNDVLSPRLDKPLYHYTTQLGLLGIISSREMWVTHTQYLNDRREFVHAVDLVREEIQRLLQTAPTDSPRREGLQRMESSLRTPETINVCVCSFSEERDSISQWRAYSSGTSGFAIGFPSDLLTAATAAKDWYLAPCIYDPSRQREIIRSLVEEVLDEIVSGNIEEGGEEDEYIREARMGGTGNLLVYLNRYAPILKDESFSAEKEWRVISRPLSSKSKDFCFRAGRSLLIPYSKFPLVLPGESKLRLQRIVVGPTQDGKRSRSSVISFLIHERMLEGLEVAVEISRVPYRSW